MEAEEFLWLVAEGKSEVESTRRTQCTVTGSEDDGGGAGAGGAERREQRGSQPAASEETETSGIQLHRAGFCQPHQRVQEQVLPQSILVRGFALSL